MLTALSLYLHLFVAPSLIQNPSSENFLRSQTDLIRELYQQALSQVKSKTYKEAWKTLDRLANIEPDVKLKLNFVKFTMMGQFHEKDAYEFARSLVKKRDLSNVDTLGDIAICIIYRQVRLNHPDYGLAIEIIESNEKLRKTANRNERIALAEAYFLMDRFQQAIATLRGEVEAMEADPKSSHMEVEMYERRLLKYRKVLDKVGKF